MLPPPCLAGEEPLAADVRDSADGKPNALLKVISGVLRVPFDRISQRERHRHRRQLFAIVSLALVVTAVTSSLALMALFARQDAERRLQQSEDLISFILEDLRGRLETLGKLEVLDAVGDKAMDYFASLVSDDVGQQTLVKHAVALRQIGEVRSRQGHADAALEAFRESLTLLHRADQREPDNLDVLFQMAQTRFWIGGVHFQRLDYGAAQEEIRQYRDLALRMLELEPLNADHRMEVAFAENNLGALALRTNRPVQAKGHFLQALAIKRELLEKDPENRTLLLIVMGKTDPDNSNRHNQQSMVLVPVNTPGVKVVRSLEVFGWDDAPEGHGEVHFENVRVPISNILLGEGRGFEVAQGRLGPGRIHHCMRSIGAAQRALEAMCVRAENRTTFGKKLSQHQSVREDIAKSYCEIEQARLLTLKAAHKMDKGGNKEAQDLIAMIKIIAPAMSCTVIDLAMQIHGGAGVCQDFFLSRHYALQRTLRLADGPDQVHMMQLGRNLARRVNEEQLA